MKVFYDLDNTLYSYSETGVHNVISENIIRFVMRTLNLDREAANTLANHYYGTYGITGTGLIKHHNIDPDPYYKEIHDFPMTMIPRNEALRTMLLELEGRGCEQWVFTNGDRAHALRVTAALGIQEIFSPKNRFIDIFSQWEYVKGEYVNKPFKGSYLAALHIAGGIVGERCVMIEDSAENLKVPLELGWHCVWIRHGRPIPERFPYHVVESLLEVAPLIATLPK